MITLEPLKPKGPIVDLAKIQAAIEKGLTDAALQIQGDFEKTVATWKGPAKFYINTKLGQREIFAEDQKYTWVSRGTPPHIIAAKQPGGHLRFATKFVPKTIPNVIGSQSGGSSGSIAWPKVVQHPGTKARNFDVVVAKNWRKKIKAHMQKYLDTAV